MTEQFANNATTTLNGGITSGATSLVVTSATAFPSSAQFRIIIDTEILLVTGVASNTFTVSRGQEGTTAISHLSGATVSQILTNGALQQFKSDTTASTVQASTFASRPAPSTAGRLYRPTDGNSLYIDTGSAWAPFGPIVPLVTPPTASNYSQFQTSNNGTIVDDNGSLFLQMTQRVASGPDIYFVTQANPGGQGATYTLTVGMLPLPGGKAGTGGFFNYHITGVGLYNTTTTIHKELFCYTQGDGAFRYQCRGGTGLTSSTTLTFDVGGYSLMSSPLVWFRIKDDGTNRQFMVSNDGRHFQSVTTEANTTLFGSGTANQPNQIGIYLSAEGADARSTVISYQLTSP